ncbi:MAG: MT-A70 family methyltransferase [Mycobacteriales bacterium]
MNNSLAIPGKISPVGLTLPAGLSFKQWLEVVKKLSLVSRACLWWWGDALCYGEGKWGEKYGQALDESDYEYQTLANAKYVASRIHFSFRKENLTFNHHMQVAGLEAVDRDRLLLLAESERWSVQVLRREVHRLKSSFNQQNFPDDLYRIVYADPPWEYGDKLIEGYGSAEHHYPSLSIEELCALDICSMTLPDAVLFLWVTSPLLESAFAVIKSWEFEYKTSFVWDKVKHNYGHYNSVRHELLLIATRGSCTPDTKVLEDSVVSIERTESHSEKPGYFRDLIDKLYPKGKRIELFARAQHEGWDAWGNEGKEVALEAENS